MSSNVITFAVFADTHIGQPADKETLARAFERISAIHPTISRVIHLGSITNTGSTDELKDYLSARKSLRPKIFEVLGASDKPLFKNAADLVEKELGGGHFADEIKGWGLCGISDDMDEDAWDELLDNLEDRARTGRRLAFVHHFPSRETVEYASDAGVKAIFYAYHHCVRAQTIEGVELIGTPALLVGGLDNSPASVRLIHCKGSKLWTEIRPIGMDPLFFCQSRSLRPDGGGEIEVIAYDSVNPVEKVIAVVGEGRNQLPMPLKPRGEWMYQVRLPTGLKKAREFTINAVRDGAPNLELTTSLIEQPVVEPVLGDDWQSARYDLTGNACFKDTLLGEPALLWTTPASGHIPGGGSSNPILASGKLYISVSDFSGTAQNGILTLSARDGRILWKSKTNGQVRGAACYSTLVGSEGVLLINDSLGQLICISAEDGSHKWRYEYQNISGWAHTSPIVEKGRIYAGTARDFVCLSISSGQKIWRAPKLGGDWPLSMSTVVMDENRLFVGLAENGLVALNKRTGNIDWQISAELYGSVVAPPIVVNDIVYVGTVDGHAIAANAKNGKIVFDALISNSGIISAPVCNGKRVVFTTLSGSIVCLDAKTGNITRQIETGEAMIINAAWRQKQPSISSSPVLTGEIAHIGGMDGYLRGYHIETGQQEYSVYIGGPIGAGLCRSGNTIFLTTYDGRIQAWAFSGKPSAKKQPAPVAKKPAADEKPKKAAEKSKDRPKPIKKRPGGFAGH